MVAMIAEGHGEPRVRIVNARKIEVRLASSL
jgi:hypothetical protein